MPMSFISLVIRASPVTYNSACVNKSLCPEVIRDCGVHVPMKSRRKGYLDWDYQQVKMALGK